MDPTRNPRRYRQGDGGRPMTAAPDLLAAAQCALADFEGILSEFDPEREHPAWETLAELRTVIAKATGGVA